MRERIEIVPLYFARRRPMVERDGLILMVDDDRLPLDGEKPRDALGALPDAGLLSAVGRGRERRRDRRARSSPEMLLTTTSERQGRAIDRDAGARRMEKKKQEGYF